MGRGGDQSEGQLFSGRRRRSAPLLIHQIRRDVDLRQLEVDVPRLRGQLQWLRMREEDAAAAGELREFLEPVAAERAGTVEVELAQVRGWREWLWSFPAVQMSCPDCGHSEISNDSRCSRCDKDLHDQKLMPRIDSSCSEGLANCLDAVLDLAEGFA